MKDFKLRGTEHLTKSRVNRKLQEEEIKRVKETGSVDEKSYLAITNPKKKSDYVKDTEIELSKAKEENSLGVPNSFYDLNKQEQSMLMFFLSSDFVHPILNKRTHMNMLYSYIAAFIDDKELSQIFEIEYSKVQGENEGETKVEPTGIKRVKNYRKHSEVEMKATAMFNSNPAMKEAWNDLIEMSFGADPAVMIKNAILKDAIEGENYQDKNANRKMAISMLGLDKQESETGNTVNVFVDGGGQEFLKSLQQGTNDPTLTTAEDLDDIEEE